MHPIGIFFLSLQKKQVKHFKINSYGNERKKQHARRNPF